MKSEKETKIAMSEMKSKIATIEWDKSRNQLNVYKETLLSNLKKEYDELKNSLSN